MFSFIIKIDFKKKLFKIMIETIDKWRKTISIKDYVHHIISLFTQIKTFS